MTTLEAEQPGRRACAICGRAVRTDRYVLPRRFVPMDGLLADVCVACASYHGLRQTPKEELHERAPER